MIFIILKVRPSLNLVLNQIRPMLNTSDPFECVKVNTFWDALAKILQDTIQDQKRIFLVRKLKEFPFLKGAPFDKNDARLK